MILGAEARYTFEVNGTRGAVAWDFERMNELQLFLPDGTEEHNGPVLIQSGPQHPFYASFYPGPALSMSYDDLKMIETFQFLRSVAEGKQGEPGFAEALAVAEVQDAMERSWASERWEDVKRLSDA